MTRAYENMFRPYEDFVLVLNPAQISNWDLVCKLLVQYPGVKLIAQQRLPLKPTP